MLGIPLAIDGRSLHARTGVGTYAKTLRAALMDAGLSPVIVDDHFVRHTPGNAKGRVERWRRWLDARIGHRVILKRRTPNVMYAHDVFRRGQVHWNRRGELLNLRVAGAPGIVHWTYPVPLHIEGWANVYTLHDAIPLLQPELTSIDPVRHRRMLEAIVRQAAGLITVTEAAQSDLCQALALPPWSIINCYQACVQADRVPDPPVGLQPGRFLVFCGTIEPRKNVTRLVAAWRASGTEMPLVMVGPEGENSRLSQELRMQGATILGYQPKPVVDSLIAHARALLLPSLAEGFGLPICEAMAAGTPVMTSRYGAMAEVAGDAALLVDPLDVTGMAQAIQTITEDEMLCARLKTEGLRRAADFSLDGFAGNLLAAYGKIVSSREGGYPST